MKNHKARYNINDITRETYYQLPKVFFTKHSKYENLSLSAAVAFSFLKDRLNYSIRHNWVDENGDIFFIFTNTELMEALKVSSAHTVVKIKKELEKYGLLEQKRMGLNKPNQLYLLQPEVTASDVYEVNYRKKALKTLEPQGSAKNALPENDTKTLEPQGSAFFAHNQYKEEEDTRRYYTDTHLDFSAQNYSPAQIATQNTDLVTHSNDLLQAKDTPVFLNTESVGLIKAWCTTPKQVYRMIQIILNAKNAVVKEMINNGLQEYINIVDLENLKSEITVWLRNYFNRIRITDGSADTIKNFESYLYSTMVNNLNRYTHQQLQKIKKK